MALQRLARGRSISDLLSHPSRGSEQHRPVCAYEVNTFIYNPPRRCIDSLSAGSRELLVYCCWSGDRIRVNSGEFTIVKAESIGLGVGV